MLRLTIMGGPRGVGQWSRSTACMLPRVPSLATGRSGDTLPRVLAALALTRLQQCNFKNSLGKAGRPMWGRRSLLVVPESSHLQELSQEQPAGPPSLPCVVPRISPLGSAC